MGDGMARQMCEHCGAVVPPGATACPECGSDEQTGWADEDSIHDALFSVDEEELREEYEDVVRELGSTPAGRRSSPNLVLVVIAAITAIAILAVALF
jgi:glutaredoxin